MIVSSFSVLFCSFQVQFFSFIRQFFSDSILLSSVYFLVSRPRIAKVLCFLRWTEQTAYLFCCFNLSKKKKTSVTCLPGLLAITFVSCFVLDCLLICYFVMLPRTVFMHNLFFFISRFQTIFSPFLFSGFF